MGPIATQITSLTVVYSTVYSDADQGKHQSSASLAFVWGIHRGPVNSPHKWPVTRKMFPFDDVIMNIHWKEYHLRNRLAPTRMSTWHLKEICGSLKTDRLYKVRELFFEINFPLRHVTLETPVTVSNDPIPYQDVSTKHWVILRREMMKNANVFSIYLHHFSTKGIVTIWRTWLSSLEWKGINIQQRSNGT